jgi:MFS family permease
MIGVMALAQAIPIILISLLGGAIADRMQKKYIMFAGRLGSVGSALGIALALSLVYLSPEHPGSWWVLIASAVLDGTIIGFTQPALIAIVTELVGKEQVMNAISLSGIGQTIFRLLGPIFAGFLIDSYGFFAVYYLMAGLNTAAAIGTLFLPRTGMRTASRGSTIEDILEGLRYMRRETIFLLIVVFALCHMIAGAPHAQLLPVFTETILKVSATKLGLLNSVSSFGALLGAFIIASLPNRKRGVLLILSGIIEGLPVMVFSFSRCWSLSLAMMPFIGLSPTIHGTMTTTLIQTYTAPEYRARMQSLVAMASGISGFVSFLAGALTDAIGVQWAVGGLALLLILISFAYLAFATRLRKLD